MRKYCWTFHKTREFLQSRRPDIALKQAFLQQLHQYERRLLSTSQLPFSADWTDTSQGNLESEDLLLRNTFLNSQPIPAGEPPRPNSNARRLAWADAFADDKSRLERPPHEDRLTIRMSASGQPILKSIIKKISNGRVEGVSVASRQTTASSAAEAEQLAGRQGHNFRSSVGEGKPTVSTAWSEPEEFFSSGAPQARVTGLAPGRQEGSRPGPDTWAAPSHLHDRRPDVAAVPEPGSYGHPGTVTAASVHPATPDNRAQYLRQSYPAPQARGTSPGTRRDSGAAPGTMQKGYGARPDVGGRPGDRGYRDGSPGIYGPRAGAGRDPSPRTDSQDRHPPREPSPGMVRRGESPQRLLKQPGKGPVPQGPRPGGPGPSGIAHLGMSLQSLQKGGGPQGGGMAAYRSGGPVKAKAEVVRTESGGVPVNRQPRPVMAGRTTSHPQQRGGGPGSRPASPLGAKTGTGSRQGSPASRPPSPGAQKRAGTGTYGPSTAVDKVKRNNMSSQHYKRTPSPTPMNLVKNKPQWKR
mmetsp:Transcript_81430/g.186306  ORF Transcript_81430/g.186306 Transcript_81430/m.186306 type:complete len:524 (-) Transcript_81430:54-1625(-)